MPWLVMIIVQCIVGCRGAALLPWYSPSIMQILGMCQYTKVLRFLNDLKNSPIMQKEKKILYIIHINMITHRGVVILLVSRTRNVVSTDTW